MKFSYVIYIISGFVVSGCLSQTEKQKKLLNKTWYGNSENIEFRADYVRIHFISGSHMDYTYDFISENEIVIHSEQNPDNIPVKYSLKDSVLLLMNPNPKESADSCFYHLNPNYEEWQRKQIFLFGKVVTEKEPLPFVKFEF